MEELAKKIISLEKSDRQKLARLVRMNEDLWNAVHGLGDVRDDLPDGKVEGLVVLEDKLEKEVRIIAIRKLAETVETVAGKELEAEAARKVSESEVNADAVGSGEEEKFETMTDANGYYILDLPVGKYDISYEKDGLQSVQLEDTLVVTGHTDTINASMIVSK